MKIRRILLAWWYVITQRNNKLSRDRLVICAHCEFYKWQVCTKCGCPGISKTKLEDEHCPIEKW